MRVCSRAVVVVSAVCGALLCSSAHATTVKAFDTPSLVRSASLIVRAKVQHSTSFWNTTRNRIYTDTGVLTDAVYYERSSERATVRKGQSLIIRQLGGQTAEAKMTVPGTAPLADGDEVVLFLRKHAGFYTLVGMAQGCVVVRASSDGPVAITELSGATLLRSSRSPSSRTVHHTERVIAWVAYERRLEALIQQRVQSEEAD